MDSLAGPEALPLADHAGWLAEVQRELRGADFDRALTTLTREGVRQQPLYTEGPATPPELRAAAVARLREGRVAPRVLPLSCAGGPAGLPARVAEDLAGGADGGVVLEPDAPTTAAGWAAVWSAAAGARGPWRLPGGADALTLGALALAGAAQAGVDPGPLHLGADPLGALVATGRVPLHLDQAVDELAELLAQPLPPGSRGIGVDLGPWAGAGADLALALGWGLSDLFWLARALEPRGVPLAALAAQVSVTVPMGRDLLGNVAALRALRVLWDRALRAAGLEDPPGLWIHTSTSPAVLSRRDPAVNALRGTLGCAAALLGGADSVAVAPMDLARGQPSAGALRLARNTPLVLLAEAHLGAVLDPLAGAYAVESLTEALARQAWAQLQALEAEGGAARSVLDGAVQRRVAAARQAWELALRRRQAPTVGVSDFADPAEAPAPTPGPCPAAPGPVGVPLTLPEEGLFPALRALAAGGADRAALDRALGRGPAMTVQALEPLADSAPFEALRDRLDRHLACGGPAPGVFLATVGPVGEWKARATWVRNLLAAAGVRVLEDEQGAPPEDAVQVVRARFAASGARAACLCLADTRFSEAALPLAQALAQAGAAPLLFAGRPGALEPALREAGVHSVLALGQDAAAALEGVLDALGVPR